MIVVSKKNDNDIYCNEIIRRTPDQGGIGVLFRCKGGVTDELLELLTLKTGIFGFDQSTYNMYFFRK